MKKEEKELVEKNTPKDWELVSYVTKIDFDNMGDELCHMYLTFKHKKAGIYHSTLFFIDRSDNFSSYEFKCLRKRLNNCYKRRVLNLVESI